MNYVAVIHKDPDSDFGVSFPDFPGCITAGPTLTEAKAMAREALSGHIAEMRAGGEALPIPSTFEVLMTNPDFQDGLGFLVHVDDEMRAAVA